MRICFIFLLAIIFYNSLFAQNPSLNPGYNDDEKLYIIENFNPLQYVEPVQETSVEISTEWVRNIVVYPYKVIHLPADNNVVKQIKAEKRETKIEWSKQISEAQIQPDATEPIVFNNFSGNDAKEGTPTDNSIAISNDGIIVSAINSNIRYYNTKGDKLYEKTFYDFLADTNLKGKLYDPVVTYDPQSDRFIFVLLHGNHSSNSKLIICFSKNNNPQGGWNKYYFPITNISSTYTSKWIDFPKVGVSNDDLFVTGNIFINNEGGFSESIILQIDKQKGYQNKSLVYRVWKDIKNIDNDKPFTIYPVSWGKNGTYGPGFYFISTKNSGNNNKIYFYEITGRVGGSPTPVMKTSSAITNNYILAADAIQKRSLPTVDPGMLDVGDCRIQSAFYQISRGEGIIHYVHHAEYNQSVNAISYGRLRLSDMKITEKTFANASYDYAYPAIASSSAEGDDSRDIILAYLAVSPTTFPGLFVVSCDDAMTFSSPKSIKEGDANVNILSSEDERWGDYTGISRKHNTSAPRIWISGAYGSSIKSGFPPVTSYLYKNHIAEVSDNSNTSLEESTETATSVVYPNPVHQICNVSFNNQVAGMVSITIFNQQGQYIFNLFKDYLKAGKANLSLNLNALSNGVYYIKVERENQVIYNEKIIVNQ